MDDFEFSFVPRSRHFRGNQGPSSTRITSPPIVAGCGRIWMEYDGCDVEPYRISPNIHGALESGHKFFEDFAGMILEKELRFLGAQSTFPGQKPRLLEILSLSPLVLWFTTTTGALNLRSNPLPDGFSLAFMCRIGRLGCMNNSLNESYHNSVAFSPNSHAPNLCTHPRATLKWSRPLPAMVCTLTCIQLCCVWWGIVCEVVFVHAIRPILF